MPRADSPCGVVDAIGLRVEAGYVEKGAGAEVNEDGMAGQLNIEIDYLVLRGLLEIGGDFHLLAGATVGRDRRCNVAIDVSIEGIDKLERAELRRHARRHEHRLRDHRRGGP